MTVSVLLLIGATQDEAAAACLLKSLLELLLADSMTIGSFSN